MNMRSTALSLLLLTVAGIAPAASAQSYRGNDAIECSSRDFRFTRCGVYWKDARLIEQTSDTRCTRGRTWGVDGAGLWVDKGCAGLFRPAGKFANRDPSPGYGGAWHPGPGWDGEFSIRCASRDYAYNFCAVDVGGRGRVRVGGTISSSPCIEGRTWGWNRAGVWVDDGCEAEFLIDRRWR